MSKKSFILKSIPYLFVILVTCFPVLGSDISVICNLNDCKNGEGNFCTMLPSSGAPLFEETNMLPGYSVKRSITISNTGSCGCENVSLSTYNETLGPSTPTTFPSELFTVIKHSTTDIYGVRDGDTKASNFKDLQDVYDASSISLGSLDTGQTKKFDWVFTFNPNAGNEYQGVRTQFDFKMSFSCGTGPEDKSHRSSPDKKHHNDKTTVTEIPTVAGFFASLITPIEEITPEVAGVSEEKESTPSVTPEVEEVAGASVCVDPWWWWLLFVLQGFVYVAIYKLVSEKYLDRRTRFYVSQFLNTALFVFIFYKFFCPWWDWILSALMGFFAISVTYKKFFDLQEKKQKQPSTSFKKLD